eukprot:TRINITY_DN257_c1_g1_i9.p1 TRINITY_DN257_c1_g1~~TRINITY_DN257_c1_g1_i9.p1  ORF type:complete len:244 (+),score=-35.11 TRINITY_DN257_c1_g1_i9:348-1079(+)
MTYYRTKGQKLSRILYPKQYHQRCPQTLFYIYNFCNNCIKYYNYHQLHLTVFNPTLKSFRTSTTLPKRLLNNKLLLLSKSKYYNTNNLYKIKQVFTYSLSIRNSIYLTIYFHLFNQLIYICNNPTKSSCLATIYKTEANSSQCVSIYACLVYALYFQANIKIVSFSISLNDQKERECNTVMNCYHLYITIYFWSRNQKNPCEKNTHLKKVNSQVNIRMLEIDQALLLLFQQFYKQNILKIITI